MHAIHVPVSSESYQIIDHMYQNISVLRGCDGRDEVTGRDGLLGPPGDEQK